MRYVYIVRCNDSTLYTWISNNLEKRIDDHNNSKTWAKYTKARRPVKLVWQQKVLNRNEASRLELKIKKMWKKDKESLLCIDI